MPPKLLVAAHGTRSATGRATIRALADAVQDARPATAVSLCFLDVAEPSLRQALDAFDAAEVIVVPLLLSAGYHVEVDIPRIVTGRDGVRVARHLGPDPLVIEAVADRLAEARGSLRPASTVLAAVPSQRESAAADVTGAASALAERLGRAVLPATATANLAALPRPIEVAPYLLAEGDFLDRLRDAGADVVAEPIGVHPALVPVVWSRYDEAGG
jgi:sirohydrochlorin ferrochelatase